MRAAAPSRLVDFPNECAAVLLVRGFCEVSLFFMGNWWQVDVSSEVALAPGFVPGWLAASTLPIQLQAEFERMEESARTCLLQTTDQQAHFRPQWGMLFRARSGTKATRAPIASDLS